MMCELKMLPFPVRRAIENNQEEIKTESRSANMVAAGGVIQRYI